MSNAGFLTITPPLTFRPLSPFLAMLIASATRRLEGPEELAPTSVVQPRTVVPCDATAPAPGLDRTV